MRQPFFKRITTQLPVLFPLVALFHVILLLLAIWFFWEELSNRNIQLIFGILIIYTVLWIAVCDLKRWAGIGYILLTAACLVIQYFTPKTGLWYDAAIYFFPFNILMTFFILFYYKRLQ